ncbi:MAG TPA: hypothetical protein VG672_23835 [Bryobacteraceae bacterium]|nr:hypothetical protein [Bryobacteraceae bacterium]
MVRFRYIIALILLASWLPATQRCALRAAGVSAWLGLHESDDDDCPPGTDCGKDGCQILEQHLVQPAALVMVTPAWHLLAFLPELPMPELQVIPPPAPVISCRPQMRQLRVVRCWHFERRSALSPRAPSLTC